LGIAAVLVDFLVSGPGATWRRSDVIPANCIYEVYQDDQSLGTIFLKHPENLPEILSKLGLARHSTEVCGRIPCNRAIRLNRANGTVAVDKIQGSHLIAAGKRVDVNLADATDLQAVPGIGPQLSQRIIATRDSRGGFGRLDDLRQVPGIGPKKLSEITQYIEMNAFATGSERREAEPPVR
jgi:competence ComEA-like helix-hairpin-helix protein